MKIFIDTADPAAIKKFAEMGIIAGVTTNPTLLVKQMSSSSGTSAPSESAFARQKAILKEICEVAACDVLAEPVSTDAEHIISEAVFLCSISKRIVAKIPLTAEGLKAAATLKKRNIRVAFTLVFSAEQAILAAAAGADYICPFVGRLDDNGQKGTEVIGDMAAIYNAAGVKTRIVAASIRNTEHILECARRGSYAATVPPSIIDEMVKHELTAKGVEKFTQDWSKVAR
jgi:transaldolase